MIISPIILVFFLPFQLGENGHIQITETATNPLRRNTLLCALLCYVTDIQWFLVYSWIILNDER